MKEKDKNNEELQKYNILMSYLQYENSSFWDRNNFFILANTALLGFLIANLPNIYSPTSWERILIPFVYCFAGLFLSLLWRSALKKSEFWIKHWHSLLKKIEAGAFGELFVLRDDPNKIKKSGAKKIAYKVWGLFFVLWILSILYIIIAICVKCIY